MTTTIQTIADFAASVKFLDLPDDVVHETKRLILDSVGCALAGVTSEKGRWGLSYASALFGGLDQATVLGFGDRLSLFGAAFVNGELINGLDYDAAGRHLPPFVIPSTLAVAENKGASGNDLITACALAHEIGIRIGASLGSHRDIVDHEVKFPPVAGHSAAVFGGTAGVAWLEGFDKDRMASALGLAGHISPGQVQTTMIKNVPATTAKYLLAGWVSQAELTAVYLAKAGHRGDVAILDGDWGYWRYTGSAKWDAPAAVAGLGQSWRFPRGTPMKLYPCCRIMHGALDCLAAIQQKHQLRPDEIDSMKAYMEASCVEPIFHNAVIETQVDAQFSVAYNLAVHATGVPPGTKWQDPVTMKDPDILRLMSRITFESHPDYIEALKNDHEARMSRVDIHARGSVFSEERTFIKGTKTADPATYISDDELIEKFRANASTILPEHKTEEAWRRLLDLEHMNDISELMVSLRH